MNGQITSEPVVEDQGRGSKGEGILAADDPQVEK